ncbi:MAG: hypothetical protein IT370_21730 [Deltaproteobacteria bacterium]|nr:hypothetical protein [Deltaproteobacteria bacterium]
MSRQRTTKKLGAMALAGVLAGQLGAGQALAQVQPSPARSYREVVLDVASMVNDGEAQQLAAKAGLQILNVLWEDTGRWEGSSVGPNISDVTIEVQTEAPGGGVETALMPVIRNPNFEDKTGDVKLDQIRIRVGNQRKGGQLESITLRQFLAAPSRFMTMPGKGTIKGGTLLAPRDSHALVSAQASFLPIPRQGKATFWPVIFNYQSYAQNPAVLTLLVTRQGTSMTIIDNARDTVTGGASWGQRLFMNVGGQAAPLTAERLSDVKAKGTTSNGESAASVGADANLLMLIQVPLKVKTPSYLAGGGASGGDMEMAAPTMAAKSAPATRSAPRESDVEQAVLGHGPVLGPYTELDGLTIERDPRFPVRVTVQFYQATSNGAVSAADVAGFAAEIDKVYKSADYVGSLVVPRGQKRPTQWTGVGPRPENVTWEDFRGLYERMQKYGWFSPQVRVLPVK